MPLTRFQPAFAAVLLLVLSEFLSRGAEPESAPRPLHAFSCVLPKEGLTSAGIFAGDGRLVRVLWTMKSSRGRITGEWDGLDDHGMPAPAGKYTWKVVLNRSNYKNVGTIGNTGTPPTTFGHVPVYLEGVAVDSRGGIYTVHDWEEAHFDIIKWSAANGQAEFNTGHHTDALLKGIAVEPDGSRAYVSGYADIQDRSKARFTIWRFKLASQRGKSRLEPFAKAGRCIVVYDGQADLPASATAQDREVMAMPLLSLALAGDSLYGTDALKGRILVYDKESGELKREFPLPLACGLAVDAAGRIWAGHEHGKVSVLDADGNVLATPITDLKEVRALAFRDRKLYVADREAGEIRVYAVDGTSLRLLSKFGQPARPGDRLPERFSKIQGMTVDGQGNIIVTDRVGQGSRLQKFSSDFRPLWRQMGLEFSSQGAFGKARPDLLITANKNAYKLDRSTGGWKLLGPAKTEHEREYFGSFDSSHFGPPRVVRMGEKDFFYYPAGDGLAIYEIALSGDASRGPLLKLVSCLAGCSPLPDGTVPKETWKRENRFLWSWHDEQGDNAPQSEEIAFAAVPENPKDWEWPMGAISVDDRGWLWVASYVRSPPHPREESAIYAIAPRGLNKLGNPIYDWNDAVRMVSDSAGPRALGTGKDVEFLWKLAGHSLDGMVYGLAVSKKPGLPQSDGMHMGGNVLMGFERKNAAVDLPEAKWAVGLPRKSVGLSPIPGGKGGVFIGGDPFRGGVSHYTRDGLLVGAFQSDAHFGVPPDNLPSGLLDAQLAVNCHRDPRDGLLDVFTEDNYNQRLIWYRVDDRDISVMEGSLSVPE